MPRPSLNVGIEETMPEEKVTAMSPEVVQWLPLLLDHLLIWLCGSEISTFFVCLPVRPASSRGQRLGYPRPNCLIAAQRLAAGLSKHNAGPDVGTVGYPHDSYTSTRTRYLGLVILPRSSLGSPACSDKAEVAVPLGAHALPIR